MTATIRKFLFDEDFDNPNPAKKVPVEPEAPPPPPPPSYSASDLAKARSQGYQDGEKAGRQAGQQAGKAEAEAQVNARIAQTLHRMGDAMAHLIGDRAALHQARTREPVEIALILLRRFWPELERRHGLAEIEAMMAACLGDLIDEPKLVVKVHGSLAEQIREKMGALARERGFEGRLVVLADDKVAVGTSRVEWGSGGAVRDTGEIFAEIEATAARLLTAGA